MLVKPTNKSLYRHLISTLTKTIICATLLLSVFYTASCTAQSNANNFIQLKPNVASQISEYIPSLYADTKGNLWIGCLGNGVCRYDGKKITYFDVKDGLGGATIRAIAEDHTSNIWLGTEGGLTKWDGKQFRNYNTDNGLPANEIWRIFVDKDGTIWVGTLSGICYCKLVNNAKTKIHFTPFHLPSISKIDYTAGALSSRLALGITQDRAGNMWFATNGGGAYRYNGKTLTNFSEKNGLSNDFVQCILEDKKGYIWFITRHGGACRYNPLDKRIAFDTFDIRNGLCTNECWNGLADKEGNIWITTQGFGFVRYNGKEFTSFSEKYGITRNHVQSLTQDLHGTIWLGFSGGLFCLRNNTVINVTKNGPWR